MQTETDPTLSLKKKPRPIYLDNNATTPLDPSVLTAMRPYLEEEFGNASSKNHSYGWKAEMAVEKARKQVAELLNCEPQEIYWTSGATESNNMILQGVALNYMKEKVHLLTSPVEHKAVLDACKACTYYGAEVELLKVNSYGQVQLEDLKSVMKPETRLVSIMAANNEIGSLNDIEKLSNLTQQANVLFHCDAAQAVGKFPIDLQKWKIDYLSLSGHKIYGPKGVGAVFIRKGQEKHLRPLLFGGSQEKGLRPGTLNVAGIVGLGEACELAGRLMESEHRRLREFQTEILRKVNSAAPDVILNGDPDNRLCNNISLSFPGLSPDVFALSLSGLALSSGSACTSGSAEPSHVLTAIGREPALARATLRLGLGRFTTAQEVATICDKLMTMVQKSS